MKALTKKKKIIISVTTVLLALLIPLIIWGGLYLGKVGRYKRIIDSIEIVTPDLREVASGTYEGDFDAIMVAAKVSVTVEDGVITDIVLKSHKTDKGKNGERITESVLAEQTLNVEMISGATNSCKVILKSIEIALNKGILV